ncbi:hypothetical protein [Lacticaseibacillus zeae]|uniref:hypothetical protein n=1 Tax=Lacticaseibacillus zeae TaxID=57037 RepID=UPI0027957623|nr:hypothetical protein [Lacticaseibacillus sp. NCIMB 15474]WLV86348.1 hypothetical protein LACZS1_002794 [Lacticaseibacillus sp. NCIMB 15474]
MPVTGSDIRCLVQPRPYLKEQSLNLCQNASASAVLKVGLSRLKLFQHTKNGHLCPPIENDKSRSQLPKQNDLLNKKLAIFMTKEVSVMMILYCLDFSEAKSNLVYKMRHRLAMPCVG